MLNIEQMSYWEQKTYFEGIDFLIIGSGITGLSAGITLKNKYPEAKVVILERGNLPSGASSKNAGFASFGSVSELLDDLSGMDEDTVWSTVEKRWRGLQYLLQLTGKESIQYEQYGSWDLILPDQLSKLQEFREKIPYLNEKMESVTGEKNVFSEDLECGSRFGFENVSTSFYNRLEGQINTGKMIRKLHQIAIEKGVDCLYGVSVLAMQSNIYNVNIQTSAGFLKARKVLICTNGFAREFLPQFDVKPARAQVLVTSPIENLKIKGTFHYQEGFYYFRNIDNRILFGGGRNLDFEGETTTELATTSIIQEKLQELLHTVILPGQSFSIDYQWAGIMGMGNQKKPIIEKVDNHIGAAVRLGGMGVAMGSLVGKELAELF